MSTFRDIRVIPSQEELGNCSAPNVNANIVDGRYENVEKYLETQFHLLREDFNCNLREAIQDYVNGSQRLKNAYVYERVTIFQILLSERGVRVKLNLDTTSFEIRRSKRLLTNTIVCLSWNCFKDIIIATVTDSPQRTEKRREQGFFEVVIDPLNDFKFLQLVRENPFTLLTAIEPMNYFEAYRHNLRTLQLLDERSLPMQRYIVQMDTNEIRAPSYLNDDSTYDFSHFLPQPAHQEVRERMKGVNVLNLNQWPSCENFQMDNSQYDAFKEALTREMALIQGPPGTGKTHIGLNIVQTLLKNRHVWDAEDNNCILICCYTNHSLDQILEGILPFCKKLLRLGGRNTSDLLTPFTFSEAMRKTRYPKELMIEIEERVKQLRDIKRLFVNQYLQKASSVRKEVIPFSSIPLIEAELNSQQIQSLMSLADFLTGKKFADTIKEWLITEYDDEHCFQREMFKDDVMDINEAKLITDVMQLSHNDRWNLYRLWVKIYLKQFKSDENVNWNQYLQLRHELNQLRREQHYFVARNAKVIGATTTGAAKNSNIIRRLRPKIVIFEEAAEILEAHTVTALSEHTEHVILIGDHIQLRPATSVYELALKFNLDVSLFERLIRNNLSYSKLKMQHRMHPNVSHLLVPLFYEALENHESVSKYENVKGITNNLFFLNHDYEETSKGDSTSKSNEHECSFIASLCQHLIYQGYKQTQITVLSMYSAQYFDLKDAFSKIESLKYIRIAVVDNFQGEENDIIICSFVRSNRDNDIGFLKTPNRINVALSRAKLAFYALGNFEKMAEISQDLWQPLVQELMKNGNFGNALELRCQNHPKNTCLVSKSTDFDQFPEGCCSNRCDKKFRCGHTCSKWCHGYASDPFAKVDIAVKVVVTTQILVKVAQFTWKKEETAGILLLFAAPLTQMRYHVLNVVRNGYLVVIAVQRDAVKSVVH
ncbi:NFX1-type zinc finger-containing protein 1-like protein [Leptotrombidium deliense]|uniref:NFX1-type zinc finger-containing protein 1-like protein n=1 Tax=Leptotrombidium deliense TaxID=299467 RepID=A0A443SGT1_9ACAR|nr:NFX1-type zinc finger-containing protein 1-like protein [Leptotrombidium deliense]